MSFLSREAAALLASIERDVLDAVYPPICALCGATDLGDGLGCAEHHLELVLHGPRCSRCAARLPDMLPDGETCGACRLEPPGFARAVVLADYRASDAVRAWLLALKYGRRPDLARRLGRALGARLALEEASDVERLLVPVPLHALRRFERGYDQALLLARAAGEEAGLRVARALRRTRFTAPQGSSGTASRTANVAGAFAPRARFLPDVRAVQGRECWLVDDVVTSGATASECARVLRRAGAKRVGVMALAKGARPAGARPGAQLP
jgi:ComF family protein